MRKIDDWLWSRQFDLGDIRARKLACGCSRISFKQGALCLGLWRMNRFFGCGFFHVDNIDNINNRLRCTIRNTLDAIPKETGRVGWGAGSERRVDRLSRRSYSIVSTGLVLSGTQNDAITIFVETCLSEGDVVSRPSSLLGLCDLKVVTSRFLIDIVNMITASLILGGA